MDFGESALRDYLRLGASRLRTVPMNSTAALGFGFFTPVAEPRCPSVKDRSFEIGTFLKDTSIQ